MQDRRKTKAQLILELRQARSLLEGFASKEAKSNKPEMTRAVEEHQTISANTRMALASGSAGFGTWDAYIPEGLTAWDDNMFKIFGVSPEDFEGTYEAWARLVHPDDLDRITDEVQIYLQGDTTDKLQYRIVRPDGDVRYIDSTCTVVKDKNDKVFRMAGISFDVTNRKLAEEALENKQILLDRLVDQSPFATWISDADGVMVRCNPALLKLVNLKEDQLIGKYNVLNDPAIDKNGIREKVTTVFKEGKTISFSLQWTGEEVPHLNLKDATTVNIEATMFPILDLNGKLTNVVLNWIDVTKRKRAEDERLDLERQVQHAQKLESLGVLAGGIAHDFNNLLMTILGNADLAMYELSPMSTAHANLKEIEKASVRAAELAKQMLAYSGKGRFVVQAINGSEFIEEIAHLLEVSISKKAVLKFNFDENMPTFDGDVTQIRQIIMNLITNASEAIGDKSGIIALSTGAMDCDSAYLGDIDDTLLAGQEEPLPEGIYSYFEVADTGCGMDKETIEKIFDPFFTTKFTGRGLGMSAVLGIIRGHKGALKIYSEVGRGTTFRVLFPSNELQNTQPLKPDETDRETNLLPKGKILIVDDEDTIRAVGKQMIEKIGFGVITAPDGREAMELFRENYREIECVILDLTMPHMDGEEAFRNMRRVQPDVKVILCSGYNEQEATERFIGKGLAGFIQKPFRMAVLREKIGEALQELK